MRSEPPLPKELWDRIPPESQAAIWILVEGYERRIAGLEAEVAELKERLNQNSQNSSRPPSTDRPEVKRKPPREPWCALSCVRERAGGRAQPGGSASLRIP
jgi:transposase